MMKTASAPECVAHPSLRVLEWMDFMSDALEAVRLCRGPVRSALVTLV